MFESISFCQTCPHVCLHYDAPHFLRCDVEYLLCPLSSDAGAPREAINRITDERLIHMELEAISFTNLHGLFAVEVVIRPWYLSQVFVDSSDHTLPLERLLCSPHPEHVVCFETIDLSAFVFHCHPLAGNSEPYGLALVTTTGLVCLVNCLTEVAPTRQSYPYFVSLEGFTK